MDTAITYNNIEAHIFSKRNEIVRLKLQGVQESDERVVSMRKDIESKERLKMAILRKETGQGRMHKFSKV
jgi:hypothetical protein